jgi:host factor-I protein
VARFFGGLWCGTLINNTINNKKRITTMAAEKQQNLQDTFLNYVRKNKTPLTIFLVNGVKLQGIVSWFDNFCVLLRRDGHSQLVYKHAISTIMPGGPLNLNDQDGESITG